MSDVLIYMDLYQILNRFFLPVRKFILRFLTPEIPQVSFQNHITSAAAVLKGFAARAPFITTLIHSFMK